MGLISEAGEWLSKKVARPLTELATEAYLKLGGKEAAKKSFARSFEKIEPTLTPPPAAKEAAQATETVVKKTTRHGHMSADEFGERLKAAAASGEKAGVKAADSAADGAKAAATAEKAGVKAADATADGVKAAAVTGEKLTWRETRRILNSDTSLAEKLDLLNRGQRSDLFEKALLQARKTGLKDGDNIAIQKMEGIPASLKSRVQEISDLQIKGSRLDKGIDSWKAKITDIPNHPFKSAWDVFAAQWNAPLSTLGWMKNHKAATGALAVGGVGLHSLTDGKSTEVAGNTLNNVASAYATVDKAVLATGLSIGTGVLNAVSTDGAKKFAASAGDKAVNIAGQTPGFLFTLGAHAAGTTPDAILGDPLTFSNEHPVLSFLLPNPVKHTLTGLKLAQKAGDRQTPSASMTETAPSAATATAGTAGVTRVDSTGEPTSLSSTSGSLRDRAAGAAETVRAKADEVKDKAEEALEGALANINIGAVLSDPQSAWKNLKKAAAGNPQLSGLIDMGDKYPGMKWGVLGGLALGMISGDGVKGKLGGAIRTALVLGFMFDALAGLMGKPSMTGQWMGQMITGNRGDHHAPATARYSRSPAPSAPASFTGSANDPLYKSGVTASVDVRQHFGSAMNATAPLDTPSAPDQRSGLNSSFERSASAAPAEKAPDPAPITPERKLAANADYYAIPSNG